MERFILVRDQESHRFAAEINRKLALGYELHGNMIHVIEKNYTMLVQAMVLPQKRWKSLKSRLNNQ